METDSTWFAVTAIILSAFLAVFLILGIFLLVKVLAIAKSVKKIVKQAELVADRADHISSFFEKTTGPVAFLKLISNISDSLQKKAKRK